MFEKLKQFEQENVEAFHNAKVLDLALDMAIEGWSDSRPCLYGRDKMKDYLIKRAKEEVM